MASFLTRLKEFYPREDAVRSMTASYFIHNIINESGDFELSKQILRKYFFSDDYKTTKNKLISPEILFGKIIESEVEARDYAIFKYIFLSKLKDLINSDPEFEDADAKQDFLKVIFGVAIEETKLSWTKEDNIWDVRCYISEEHMELARGDVAPEGKDIFTHLGIISSDIEADYETKHMKEYLENNLSRTSLGFNLLKILSLAIYNREIYNIVNSFYPDREALPEESSDSSAYSSSEDEADLSSTHEEMEVDETLLTGETPE